MLCFSWCVLLKHSYNDMELNHVWIEWKISHSCCSWAELCFILQFPSLCSHQNGTYLVVIEEEEDGKLVHTEGPVFRHWRDTESLVTIEVRDVLELNTEYRVTISLSIIAGQTSINSTFSEYNHNCAHVASVNFESRVRKWTLHVDCFTPELVLNLLALHKQMQ